MNMAPCNIYFLIPEKKYCLCIFLVPSFILDQKAKFLVPGMVIVIVSVSRDSRIIAGRWDKFTTFGHIMILVCDINSINVH